MDTSETYIKMCEEAREIQEQWAPVIGDIACVPKKTTGRSYFFACGILHDHWKYSPVDLIRTRVAVITDLNNVLHTNASHQMIGVDDKLAVLAQGDTDGGGLHFLLSDCLWLPRQDQLQEMVKGERHYHLLAAEFAAYFHGTLDPFFAYVGSDDYTVDSDNSMEQMWLAFVMKERWNKTWDGENWVEYLLDIS